MQAAPDAPPPAAPPPRRRWPRFWLISLGLLAVLGVGFVFMIPQLEARARAAISDALGSEARYRIAALSFQAARIEALSLGEAASPWAEAEAIALTYTPGDLLNGRVGAVRVDGLVINLDRLPAGDGPATDPRAAAVAALRQTAPVDRITLGPAELRIDGESLRIADAEWMSEGDGWRLGAALAGMGVEASLYVSAAPGKPSDFAIALSAPIEATLNGALYDDGALRGRLEAAPIAGAALTLDLTAPPLGERLALAGRGTLGLDDVMGLSGSATLLTSAASDPPTLGLSLLSERLTRGAMTIDGAALSLAAAAKDEGWVIDAEAAVDRVEEGMTRWLGERVTCLADATLDGLAGPLNMRCADPGESVRLRYRGALDGAAVDGRLDIGPVDLARGDDIRRVLPFLPADLDGRRGTVAFAGPLGFRDGAPYGAGRLTLDDLALAYDLIEARGVEADVEFVSLFPPRTAPSQRIEVAALNAGLALRDGEATFAIAPGPQVRLGGSSWRVADGRVRAGGGVFGPDVGDQRLILDVENADLEALLAAVELPDLEGTGRLSGRIPIVITEDGDIRITGARLEADEGRIAYDPPGIEQALGGGPGSPQGYLLALQDFQYDQMLAGANGGLRDGLDFSFSLSGRNPAVADRPFQFNINVEGLKPLLLLRGFDAADRAAAAAAADAAKRRR